MAGREWTERWARLAVQDLMSDVPGVGRMVERWQRLAARLDSEAGEPEDPNLEFVLGQLDANMTVVDIGAGVGRWTVPLAEHVRSVTAIEPVDGMREVLLQRLRNRGVANVDVVSEPWLDADLAPHDAAVAVASMYTSPDLAAFAAKMERVARRFCAMVMRVPRHDGVLGELSQAIRGEWHDSPNFVVGYNALLEAGYTPNVWVEPQAARYWEDASLDDAMARAKRHLGLRDASRDALIRQTLERRLTKTAAGYRWPDWMRSAVVWWAPGDGG